MKSPRQTPAPATKPKRKYTKKAIKALPLPAEITAETMLQYYTQLGEMLKQPHYFRNCEFVPSAGDLEIKHPTSFHNHDLLSIPSQYGWYVMPRSKGQFSNELVVIVQNREHISFLYSTDDWKGKPLTFRIVETEKAVYLKYHITGESGAFMITMKGYSLKAYKYKPALAMLTSVVEQFIADHPEIIVTWEPEKYALNNKERGEKEFKEYMAKKYSASTIEPKPNTQ